MEQDKYIQEIVKLTKPSFFDCVIGTNTLDSNVLQHSVTPLNSRRRFASKFEKAVQNLKPNFSSSSSSSHSSAQSAAVNNTQSNAIINYAVTKASKCKLIIRKRIKIYFTN
jgi:hypothetical protein